ncbi:type II toxin-antitoxin system YoeB family toxin [Clostridium sp. WILCCON 0269]|uniref:Endoribonuclease YoeB n=1 Tax=Candidatus Clostridium eludens TaxID=3381663 RepID=A0ABW8SNW9_9CLOT
MSLYLYRLCYINELLKDIEKNRNEGLGKPEALKHELSGYWSRRITDVSLITFTPC